MIWLILFDFDHLKISDQNGYFGDDSLKKNNMIPVTEMDMRSW
jgi:hypothetical protein